MNTEQLKQAALNGDPDAANPATILALLECVDALRAFMTHMGMDEDDWNKPTFDKARAALQKLEAL